MSEQTPGLIDRLLIRAWIEPAHRVKLRVLVRSAPDTEREWRRAFADADAAAAFIRSWLIELPQRWERGERIGPTGQLVQQDAPDEPR